MKFSIAPDKHGKTVATQCLNLQDVVGKHLRSVLSFDTATMIGKRADGSEMQVASFCFIPINAEEEQSLRDFLPQKLHAHILPVSKKDVRRFLDIRVMEEAAYLVARGVRPIALLCAMPVTPEEELELRKELLDACHCNDDVVRPFSIRYMIEGKEMVTFGYTQHQWAIDLLRYAYSQTPAQLIGVLEGVLLGYSSAAIQSHYDRCKLRDGNY